ncbi:hypothetical protein Maes01_01681 [Microbulbifer aestuariivivens]|uniref:Multidrug transporter n=1 Tax=Microbulbifer aestuariivivens TaxID=1908308 RepID=A0ABP9WPK3_9GAMM
MSELLFYRGLVALHRESHRNLKFSPCSNYRFSIAVNSVPLTGVEFFEASRDLPILFSCSDAKRYSPLALLSLSNHGHGLVDEEGRWRGSYVPAFIRRYPFAMKDGETVCIDFEASHFSEEEGEPLFDDRGENSKALNEILRFLEHYEASCERTREFCRQLSAAGLFKPFNIQVIAGNGKPVRLDGLYVIDEARLRDVDQEQVYRLFKSGELAWIYAHLHSLGALKGLAKRQEQDVALGQAKEKAQTGALN